MQLSELKEKVKENSFSISSCRSSSVAIGDYFAVANISGKRAAIISNFNLKGIGDCLVSKAFLQGVFLQAYEGQYGQWQQEILGEGLYAFRPDIIYLILDGFGLSSESFYDYHYSSEVITRQLQAYIKEVCKYAELLKTKTSAKLVISNIPYFPHNHLGIADHKFANSLHRAILEANIRLENHFKDDAQVFIFDFDGWLGVVGKRTYWYDKFYFLGDMRLSPKAIPLLAEELVSYLIPLACKTRKCLVLDLDNVLWGGIIGEDGIGGIKLSPNGDGQPYYLLQKLVLSLQKRGIILAVNSSNNQEDVLKVFREHPHMVLKEEHFAAMKINWQNKALNLKELAEEINIGLDSMVFIDDDPVNRSLVQRTFQEVEVLDLPDDAGLYFKTLSSFKGFNSFDFTLEDRERGKMYFAEQQRRQLQNSSINLESFLGELGLAIKISPLSDLSFPRAAQLTQKTNQFNLTTRRYQEEDLRQLLKDKGRAWTLSVTDKFGDYGITGLVIVMDRGQVWEIDTLLLSCRILGKGLEKEFLSFVLNNLKQNSIKPVLGKYLPTKKNALVKDFYGKLGFVKTLASEKEERWELDLRDYIYRPAGHIIIN